MNTVWNITYVRWPSIWTRYARTLGVIGLLELAAVSSTALAAFATTVARGLTATLLAVAGSSLVNLGLFLLAFMVLTAEPLRVREVAVGAVTATVFWEALQRGARLPAMAPFCDPAAADPGGPQGAATAGRDGGPPSGAAGHRVVYGRRQRRSAGLEGVQAEFTRADDRLAAR
jgi:hypothetical protein